MHVDRDPHGQPEKSGHHPLIEQRHGSARIVGAHLEPFLERVEFEVAPRIRSANQEYIGFAQDRWSVRPDLSFDLGLRYEDQRIADATLFAPRAGFAWSPSADGSTTIRGGVGLFIDKVPLNIRSFAQYPARIVTRYAVDGGTVLDRRRLTNRLRRCSLFPGL